MEVTKLPEACTSALAQFLDPELFKSLCDPRRLALLARLASAPRPLTVTEAARFCGNVHLSGVSRHLSQLKRAGILLSEKRGREVVYRLDYRPLVATLRGLADAIEQCCQTSECCPPTHQTEESQP